MVSCAPQCINPRIALSVATRTLARLCVRFGKNIHAKFLLTGASLLPRCRTSTSRDSHASTATSACESSTANSRMSTASGAKYSHSSGPLVSRFTSRWWSLARTSSLGSFGSLPSGTAGPARVLSTGTAYGRRSIADSSRIVSAVNASVASSRHCSDASSKRRRSGLAKDTRDASRRRFASRVSMTPRNTLRLLRRVDAGACVSASEFRSRANPRSRSSRSAKFAGLGLTASGSGVGSEVEGAEGGSREPSWPSPRAAVVPRPVPWLADRED
mmetsp:Transcript_10969/g.50670  ORF Transcript_10969/g.50670 Transcript_10969/m.50670 type:complete len:272 (+) Transcript_10969:3497-4312(+)